MPSRPPVLIVDAGLAPLAAVAGPAGAQTTAKTSSTNSCPSRQSVLTSGWCGSDSPLGASSLVGTWQASQVGYGNGKFEGPYRAYFDIRRADDASSGVTEFQGVAAADAAKPLTLTRE